MTATPGDICPTCGVPGCYRCAARSDAAEAEVSRRLADAAEARIAARPRWPDACAAAVYRLRSHAEALDALAAHYRQSGHREAAVTAAGAARRFASEADALEKAAERPVA